MCDWSGRRARSESARVATIRYRKRARALPGSGGASTSTAGAVDGAPDRHLGDFDSRSGLVGRGPNNARAARFGRRTRPKRRCAATISDRGRARPLPGSNGGGARTVGVVDGALDGHLCDFDSRPEGRVRGEHRARRAFWTSHAAETPTRRDDMRSRSRACTFRVERRGDAYGGCCRRRRSTSTPRASRPRSIDRRAQNSVVVHHAADFTKSRRVHRIQGLGCRF